MRIQGQAKPKGPRGHPGCSGEGEAGRAWAALGCLYLASSSINRKFRMSGLGEGRAHERWQEVLEGARAVLLTFVYRLEPLGSS